MEGESKEQLSSVSNLVTVFENNRYGVVGVGRVARANWRPLSSSSVQSGPPLCPPRAPLCPPPGPRAQALPVSRLRISAQATLGPHREQFSLWAHPGHLLLSGQCLGSLQHRGVWSGPSSWAAGRVCALVCLSPTHVQTCVVTSERGWAQRHLGCRTAPIAFPQK